MNFHRVYDISCVSDDLQRRALENAIESINLACTLETDAWLYVESGKISEDYQRYFGPNETMKNTIFNHMKLHGHSGGSIGVTIIDLVSMATEYSSWKRLHEENNSVAEGDKRILDQFRKNTLVPYYRSMSGGGSRTTAGPIVSEFLELYDTLQIKSLPEVKNMNQEITDLLGFTFQEKIDLIDDIIKNVYISERLCKYRDTLKMKIQHEKRMKEYQDDLISAQISILQAAIDSRNPVALNSALHPGWGSMSLLELKEYKEAQELLNQLEGI